MAPDAGRERVNVKLARLLPAAAYPLLAHAATVTGSASLTLASVAVLLLALLLPGLLRARPGAWLAAALAAGALAILARADDAAPGALLFLPPIVFNAFMAWLFGHTLLHGRRPLIERLVRLLHAPGEELDAAIPVYAAQLTAAWTVLFVILGATNFMLALLTTPDGLLELVGLQGAPSVPREAWSLFANVLNYVIVGVFFLAEYAYRRRRFPQQPYRSLYDFMRRAAAVAPAVIDGLGRRQPGSQR